jgi:hypothetical protein
VLHSVKHFDKVSPILSFYFNKTVSREMLNYDNLDNKSKLKMNQMANDNTFGYPIHSLVETISNFTDVFYYFSKS